MGSLWDGSSRSHAKPGPGPGWDKTLMGWDHIFKGPGRDETSLPWDGTGQDQDGSSLLWDGTEKSWDGIGQDWDGNSFLWDGTKFFSWNGMGPNLCGMGVSGPTPSQDRDRGGTRPWWDGSSHPGPAASLPTAQITA